MTPEQAIDTIANDEGQRTEFKASFAQRRPAIESLCGFAHAEGGVVIFGVNDDRIVVGVDLGKRTLEQFAQDLRQNTDPPLTVTIDQLDLEQGTVVAIEVAPVAQGEIVQAYGRFFIRVGNTTQQMSISEIRAKILAGIDNSERDRPLFDVANGSFRNTTEEFEPEWRVEKLSGDPVPNLEWRVRGPRFQMEWQQARGAHLARMQFGTVFNKTAQPVADDLVGDDEIGFEIKFPWRGKWRHELHLYHLAIGRGWDLGREIPPMNQWDGEEV